MKETITTKINNAVGFIMGFIFPGLKERVFNLDYLKYELDRASYNGTISQKHYVEGIKLIEEFRKKGKKMK